MSNSNQYYTRTAQFLHWSMALLFIVAWCIGFYSGEFLSYAIDGKYKGDVITLHKNIATILIFLFVIRVYWRATHPTPKLPDSMSPVMKTMAHAAHWILYLMIFALLATGYLYSQSAGHPVPVAYLFNMTQIVGENPDITAIVKPLHKLIAWSAGALIVLHILAALKHHFIDKDNVLRSMTRQENK